MCSSRKVHPHPMKDCWELLGGGGGVLEANGLEARMKLKWDFLGERGGGEGCKQHIFCGGGGIDICWNCTIKVYICCFLLQTDSSDQLFFILFTIKQSWQPSVTFQSVFSKGCKQTTHSVSTKNGTCSRYSDNLFCPLLGHVGIFV